MLQWPRGFTNQGRKQTNHVASRRPGWSNPAINSFFLHCCVYQLLPPRTVGYKAGAVYCFECKNEKLQVKLISWEGKRREIQSNSSSTKHWLCVYHSKDLSHVANCSWVMSLDLYFNSEATQSRKIRSTLQQARSTDWTHGEKSGYLHKAENTIPFQPDHTAAACTRATIAHTRQEKGRDDIKLIYFRTSQFCMQVRGNGRPKIFPLQLEDL